ncbi:hypothetical protein F4818DRAFT_417685 [Hypoxylon cercidicola]|nr:hypothetical protein F4818DRAFT_417685 [Hypoxylon cercidicola]
MGRCQKSRQANKLPDVTDQGAQDQVTHKSQWSILLNLLRDRVTDATNVARDNGQHRSLEEHDAYYRAVFSKVREEVAARDDIPNAVMDPPTETLILTFHGGWNETACLGCLDFHDADDVIHVDIHAKKDEPDGVTKDDILRCICEVLYGGLHMVHRDSKKETGILLRDLNWMGTTSLCNLLDTIVYIGYMPATEGFGEQGKSEKAYDVVWEAGALGNGVSSIQGYDHDYSRRLLKAKGWKEEDWDMFNGL